MIETSPRKTNSDDWDEYVTLLEGQIDGQGATANPFRVEGCPECWNQLGIDVPPLLILDHTHGNLVCSRCGLVQPGIEWLPASYSSAFGNLARAPPRSSYALVVCTYLFPFPKSCYLSVLGFEESSSVDPFCPVAKRATRHTIMW